MPNKNYLFFLVEESSVTINSLWDPVLAVSKDKACYDIAVKLERRSKQCKDPVLEPFCLMFNKVEILSTSHVLL